MPITGLYRMPWALKLMFAETETFQSLVGTSVNSVAQRSVMLFYGEALAVPPPRITIMGPEDGGSFERAKISTSGFAGNPTAQVLFQAYVDRIYQNPADPDDPTAIEQEGSIFLQYCSDIIAEMEQLSLNALAIEGEQPAHIVEHNVVEGPDRIPDEERDIELEMEEDPEAQRLYSLWSLTWGFELKG